MGLLAIFRFNQTIVHNTTDVDHCLRFYSYFTDYERNSSMTLRMSSNTIPGQDIVTVTPQKENRWYYYEISFRPIGEEYHVETRLFRHIDFNNKIFRFFFSAWFSFQSKTRSK